MWEQQLPIDLSFENPDHPKFEDDQKFHFEIGRN